MEMARFLAVLVIGLVVDVTVAWSASYFLGIPLWLAAAAGFLVAAALNYLLHEVWTFRIGMHRPTAGRMARYGLTLCATLVTRVATVAVLAQILENDYALPVLIAGAGVSFCVNYLLSKYFVFRPRAKFNGYAP
jgi:putative flippase GtrA